MDLEQKCVRHWGSGRHIVAGGLFCRPNSAMNLDGGSEVYVAAGVEEGLE